MAKRVKAKSTTKEQFLRMVEELEGEPDIAKGFTRFDTDPFWENLAVELNSLGPPTKSGTAWKKVWCDWKSNLKKKLANNRKEQQATGGGPCRVVELSALEERVVDLAGLTAAVDGIDNSVSFGAPPVPVQQNSTPANGTEIQSEDDVDEAADTENQETPRGRPTGSRFARQKRAPASLVLLEKQVEQQKKFHEDVLEAMQSHTKKIDDLSYHARQVTKRLKELQILKENQLQEQRRHNLEIEKIALEKLKTKKEILAFQLNQL